MRQPGNYRQQLLSRPVQTGRHTGEGHLDSLRHILPAEAQKLYRVVQLRPDNLRALAPVVTYIDRIGVGGKNLRSLPGKTPELQRFLPEEANLYLGTTAGPFGERANARVQVRLVRPHEVGEPALKGLGTFAVLCGDY